MAQNTNEKIALNSLTDEQKSLLTKMSYLDIDMDKFKDLKQGNKEITVSDLKSILLNPDEPYLGDMVIDGLTKFVTGVNTSNAELLEQIEESGLGDLKVIDIVDDSKSGFQGICFGDSLENRGFSFRGTDVKNVASFTKDGLADIESFLTNNNQQIPQASRLFEENCNTNGQNYLYGHSLGGFLAENIYANNHENIRNAYVINPLHINEGQLDSQDKINAFNDSEKFRCYVTGGDYVSTINGSHLFENNINYVQHSENTTNNIIGNHLIESAKFDKNGNFITSTKENAYKGREDFVASQAVSLLNNNKLKPVLNNFWRFGKKLINSVTKGFNSVKNGINSFLNKSKTNSIPNSNKTFSEYRNSLRLENWINGITYTHTDYLRAQRVTNNPLKYIQPTVYNTNPRDLADDEKVPWPTR